MTKNKTMAKLFVGDGIDRNFDTRKEAEKLGAKVIFTHPFTVDENAIAEFPDGSKFSFNYKNEIDFL